MGPQRECYIVDPADFKSIDVKPVCAIPPPTPR